MTRRGQHLAVVFIDLDGFKAINDKHGHQIGDQVLMTIASRMRKALREEDTIARLGGDEFIALLSGVESGRDTTPWLERVQAAVVKPLCAGHLGLHVSASIGVTFYPQDAEVDDKTLMRQADQAMYQAKLAGKNCCRFFDIAQCWEIAANVEDQCRPARDTML
jgi:diguanylate cyclase (GGDEF)-like protein